jgi:hypothetical protein
LNAAVKSANKVLAESRAATLDTAGYTDHEDTLTDAIKRLRGSRARAWDQRADWLREAAAQVPRDPAAAGYNAANEQAQLTATVTRILTGVPADEQQARVEELRQQALSFHRFSTDGSGHVRDLVYTALAPFDQSTTALVAVHPAGFDVAGPVVGQAGGRAQIPRLQQLLTIAGGDWTRVAPLAEVAAGNATYFKRLYDQVLIFAGARAAAYAAQPLPVRNQPPSIVGLRVGYNAAHIRHFLERHTYEWFNFGGIDTVQGFWPVGTTSDNITAYVEEALQILHPPGGPPPPPPLPPRPPMIPIPQFAIPSGFTVMVGIGYGPGGVIVVGQFFPRAGAGGVVELSDVEMRAIRQVLGV